MTNTVLGILAHVDAGKTTLSEGMLYLSGKIRSMGRVDNQDAYLDHYELERARGITIFSKQAMLTIDNKSYTLLDTPGHVDFSADMERTLQVLDYAIVVISGMDGVQGHTKTVWGLLEKYHVPTFLFINKMDQPGADSEKIQKNLHDNLDENCIFFQSPEFLENVAMCDEKVMEHFLELGTIEDCEIGKLISERRIFPCYMGSALKLTGVYELMEGLNRYCVTPTYKEDFGAKVYKVSRDSGGNRLTHMKITGGVLHVKDAIPEKVNEVRIYSGDRYEVVPSAQAGEICTVTGLKESFPGQGMGVESDSHAPFLEPVLTYQVLLPDGCDAAVMLPKLRLFEEEQPELHIVWREELQEIQVQIMGEVQIEILQSLIQERFGILVEFGAGHIIYKETITDTVEGVGHFEPLRHYAEVHLKLEPLERGMGMEFASECNEDMLDKNWQRLILTHLAQKEHLGVLTGSPITDMRITLVAGRAHTKHTEGGDFRQATYRAVRQGLMQAKSQLLEPYYRFSLEVPDSLVGRAMTDLDRMKGTFSVETNGNGTTVLQGTTPVETVAGYANEVRAYSSGEGRLSCTVIGYGPCHNEDEIVESKGYDPTGDLDNTPDSVFCSKGSGFHVPWDQVMEYMHLERVLTNSTTEVEEDETVRNQGHQEEEWLGIEEIDQILERAYGANRRGEDLRRRRRIPPAATHYSAPKVNKLRDKYLLVDGYNVIFAWDELNELSKTTLEGARGKLMDLLCNYQALTKVNLILVFDAYRVQGHDTEVLDYHNIHVVYTKEKETADQYIEKFAHNHSEKYDITVATSDGLEQIIIRGQGCLLLSARELKKDFDERMEQLRTEYLSTDNSND